MKIIINPWSGEKTAGGSIKLAIAEFNINEEAKFSSFIYWVKPIMEQSSNHKDGRIFSMVNGQLLSKIQYFPVRVFNREEFDITLEAIQGAEKYVSEVVLGQKVSNGNWYQKNDRINRNCLNCHYRRLDPKQVEYQQNRPVSALRDEGRMVPKWRCVITNELLDENICININREDQYLQDTGSSILEKGRGFVRKQKVSHAVYNGKFMPLNNLIDNELAGSSCDCHTLKGYMNRTNTYIPPEHKRFGKINMNSVIIHRQRAILILPGRFNIPIECNNALNKLVTNLFVEEINPPIF